MNFRKVTSRKPKFSQARKRRLAVRQMNTLDFEKLEDRKMLAMITVNSLADNFAPDGNVTLREAIQAANTDTSIDGSVAGSGADTITFAASLSGSTITLAGLELEISEALTVDATSVGTDVMIDGDELSRIFNITATTGDFQFNGLTLTGGRTAGDNVDFEDTTFSGAAIRSLTGGNLTLEGSTITGNSTIGENAIGGGVFSSGDLTLMGSTVSGNSTAGYNAAGGGVVGFGNVTLTGSTISGNSTVGESAIVGGVVASGNIVLTDSTVSGNSTAGDFADFGGVGAGGDITLNSSTVSGNSTAGDDASGGGIYAVGNVTLNSSTVSGNSTAGENSNGGGIYARGNVTLSLSTVTNNQATSATSTGGGIWNDDDDGSILIDGSIVAGNTAGGGMNDINPGTGMFAANFSLFGTGVTPGTGSNNLFDDNPLLGPLALNGGPNANACVAGGQPRDR